MSTLSYLNRHLSNKQDQLERLHTCERELKECRNEFKANQRFCLSPELSPTTWRGKLAKDFERIRRDGILQNYKDIKNNQIDKSLTVLHQEIQTITREINSFRRAIQSEIERLREEEKEK